MFKAKHVNDRSIFLWRSMKGSTYCDRRMFRMMILALVLLFALVTFPQSMVSARKAQASCVVNGPCELCSGTDVNDEACRATKRRQEFVCRANVESDDTEYGPDDSVPWTFKGGKDSNVEQNIIAIGNEKINLQRTEFNAITIYRSCQRTADDDIQAVVWFEVS